MNLKNHISLEEIATLSRRKDGVLGICYKEPQFPVLMDSCDERAALVTPGFFSMTSFHLSHREATPAAQQQASQESWALFKEKLQV